MRRCPSMASGIRSIWYRRRTASRRWCVASPPNPSGLIWTRFRCRSTPTVGSRSRRPGPPWSSTRRARRSCARSTGMPIGPTDRRWSKPAYWAPAKPHSWGLKDWVPIPTPGIWWQRHTTWSGTTPGLRRSSSAPRPKRSRSAKAVRPFLLRYPMRSFLRSPRRWRW